jgi:hypothetical protein
VPEAGPAESRPDPIESRLEGKDSADGDLLTAKLRKSGLRNKRKGKLKVSHNKNNHLL